MTETQRRMSRDEAIPLVQRLLDADTADEAEHSEILNALKRGLVCPHISDYIYWDTDPEPDAASVVDRAFAYKPIAL
ncbi:e9imm peptide [Streptomyces sp. NPDC007883]|uniref:e9imm peptide n=1 Tax=Streptomyces sp. NPDC007883 TaxID=3155116 RepID=UPI00340E3D67